MPRFRSLILLLNFVFLTHPAGAEKLTFQPPPIFIPDGFELEVAAAPPLVKHPMMACFDDRGRLFISETDGRNLEGPALEAEETRFIRMIEDTDGDGVFDESTIFADKMVMPEGALWLDGALYVLSAPYLWRLEDTTGDGKADKREKLVGKFIVDGRPNQHGPYLGPCGRLYFTGGIFGYDLVGTDGSRIGKSGAGSVFSCRPDGSDLQVFGQGPLNPVEVAFSPEGELFSTAAIFDNFGGRHDALIHWIFGGVTVKQYGGPLLVKETGQRLPALSRWGQVAPAGLARYRGQAFGEEYKDNLFATHFNTRRMIRTQIERKGATFESHDQDFLVSTSTDFHPTDVIEDVDGSLLVIDTGGWLYFGCPTSKIAKPNITGAIYRVRRKGAAKIEDPRGARLAWDAEPDRLVEWLDDARPTVRDRAISALAKRGDAAVDALQNAVSSSDVARLRRNAIWALSRIGSPEAKAALRSAASDREPTVRHAAARSLGILGDASAAEALAEMIQDDQQHVARAAATALGQLQAPAAVPVLLEALARSDNDLFFKHALTYALISIGDFAATEKGLASESTQVRQASLIALDQMDRSSLTFEMVIPQLRSSDPQLRKTTVQMIGQRSGWAKQVVGVVQTWMSKSELSEEDSGLLTSLLTAFAEIVEVQAAMISALQSDQTPITTKNLILDAIAASSLEALPKRFDTAFQQLIASRHDVVVQQAVATMWAIDNDRLDARLQEIARDSQRPTALRLLALATVARHRQSLSDGDFELLIGQLDQSVLPVDRRRASEALASAELSPGQRDRLADQLGAAGPLELPILLGQFERGAAATVVNVDVQPATGHAHRGLAAFADDAHGKDALWNVWNPLLGDGMPILNTSGGFYSGLSLGSIDGAELHSHDARQFDLLIGDFVYNGKIGGGGQHQEFQNRFSISGLQPDRKYDIYYYGSTHPKTEHRGSQVTVRHAGGESTLTTVGVKDEERSYQDGKTHVLFRDVRPQKDGTVDFTWTAGSHETHGNFGIFNGLTIVTAPPPGAVDEALGLRLVGSLAESPGLTTIEPARLGTLLDRFSGKVADEGKVLVKQLLEERQEKVKTLETLLPKLAGGHPDRGREVFFSKKAACYTCHRAGEQGGEVGPDLSRIGQIRTHRDLAESILFPSLTIVNGYELFSINDVKGRVFDGIIHRETPTAIVLRKADASEVRVDREDIDFMQRLTKSIMPDGLDQTISTEQLRDLIAFLKSQK